MKKGIERKTGGLRPGDFRLGFLRKDGTDNGIENEKNSQRKRKRIVKAISILACIVAFTTTYALILPAVTLERQPDCGQTEHIHTAACYTYLDEDGNVVDPGDARVLALLASEDPDAGIGESGDTVASSLRGGYPEDSESVTDAEPVAAPVDPTAENAGTDASDAHDTSETSDPRETSDPQDTQGTSDKSDTSGTPDTSDIPNPSEASSDVDAMDDATDDATLDGESADAADKTGTADPAQGTVRRILICGMEEHQHSVECYAKAAGDTASDASSESGFLASLFSGLFGHDHDRSDESDESGQSDSSVESTESGDSVDSDESAESVNSTGSVESGKSAGSGDSADSADSNGSTTKSVTVAGTTITAEYEEGILPDDVTMQAVAVPADAYVGAVADAVGKEDTEIKTFDITFLSNEQEIEPSGEVKITFQADYIAPDTDPSVVHITDDGSADLLDTTVRDDEITLTTASFSVYAISYTVDFHYEVNGKTYDFSIPGGGFVSLEHVVEVLGIAGSGENGGSESDDAEVDAAEGGAAQASALNEVEVSAAAKKFVADVESVEFSDPSLVDVSKVEEDTTVGAIKDALGLVCEYSTELTEEEIEEINSEGVQAGDWALISLKAFESEETLTVTMKSGEQFVVRVTDAQISTHVITADGEDYVITVTYGPEAGIPDGATLEAEEILLGSEEYDRYYQDAWEAIQQVENYEELTAFSSEIVDGLEENIGAKLVPTVFDIAFMRMFDISLMYENQEIEPKAPVQVTVTYANTVELSANDEAEVVHFVNNDVPEVLEVQTDKDIESNELSPEERVPFDTEEENKDEQSEFNSFSFIQSSFSVTATIVKENNSILPDGNYVILMHTTDWYALGANGGTVTTGVNYGAGDEYDLDENLIWTITYNGDGTYSVKNGDNYLVLNGSNITGGTDTGISIELSNGSGYQRAMFKNGSQKLGWNTNVNPSAFFSTNNSNQSYYLARAAVDIIDTTGTKEDDRVHYIITDHYPSGDVVRVSDYLSNGQSLSVNSNANADNLYAGVSVTAGHDAVSIGNNGAITISYNSNVHLVHLDYYYKEPLPTVQTVLFDNDDKYDTKIVEGQKYYELGEERLHTEKTASVVEGGDGRSFNLTLEAWNVDWRIATIGMVLDASGSMAWDGAAGHKMQVNSDGKYTPYKFLSQTEVNKILYTDYSDYSPAGYGDYTYYVYEDGKSVNEYAPLGYFNGANKVTSNGQTYITQDGTLSTAYATQVSIQDKRAGWYYVNTGNATPYKDIGGSKEYDGISTSSSITNHSQSVVKADGTTKSIDFANNNGYSSSIKEWFVDNDTTGTYRKTSTYGSSQGTPAQFYVDDDGYLHCFYMHSNQIFESFVYKKTDEETIKTEMLQDAIGSFTGTLYSIAPDSAVGMTRFSRSNTTNKNGFDDNQLPLLNWTTDSTAIIGALNQAYGGEYLAKSSKTDSGYGNAGNLTVYDYGLTGNTSTQSGLTSFNTYLASSNAALTKWAQDNAKPVQGGYEYDKYVIVFTDGKDTDRTNSYSANAKNAADALKKKGYNVITVLLAPESAFGSNGSLNTEFTDAKNFLDTLNGVRTDKVVSGLEWTDTTYIASASDKSALKNIFIEIAQKIAKTMEDMTIRDYIDPRFRLVDENDNPVSLGEHPELGFTLYYDAERDMQYVEWTGQDIPTNNVVNNTVVGDDGQPAEISLWSQTIRVRAKDDFLGGNEVLSNGNVEELNKVYPDGHPKTTDSKTSRTFPRTTVDPQVLGLELGTTEDTLYLGETIDATEHDKLEDAIGATVDSSWYYEYLTRYGKVADTDWITQLQQGRKVEIPYYYIPDGTTKSTFDSASLNPNNLDAYMKDRIGTLTYEWVPCDADGNEITMTDPYNHLTTNTDDIHYRLKIKYTPYTESERVSQVNSMIDTDDYGRPVKDPVGAPQTVVESAKNEGIATIHVVSGQVTVSKQIKKEDILKYLDGHQSAVFTFKLTKTGSSSSTYPDFETDYVEGHGGYKYPDSISVTVTRALVDAAEVSDGYVTITGTKVVKLPRGIYEIEEITPSDPSFEFESIGHLNAPENYRASVTDASGKVTFELGELASDANVSNPVLTGKTYLNAQQVSIYARNKVNLAVPVSIKKMDVGNTSTLLSSAEFSLYGSDAVDADGELKNDAVAVKTGLTTLAGDNLGFADMNDTNMGTYYLVETKAPAGYIMPEYEYIKIIVSSGEVKYQAGKTGEPKTAEKITRNGREVYCVEVFNSAGVTLPSTGGSGTTCIYFSGIMLTGLAGVGLVMQRRRRKRS